MMASYKEWAKLAEELKIDLKLSNLTSGIAKEWLQDDDLEDLYILTVNDAGDDGWDGASWGKIDTSVYIRSHKTA